MSEETINENEAPEPIQDKEEKPVHWSEKKEKLLAEREANKCKEP